MRYKIIYDEPGRLRIRAGRDTFTTEQGYGIEKLILMSHAAISVETTPANGGVLVCYKPEFREHIFSLLDGLDRQNLPTSTALDINYKRELDSALFRSLTYIVCRHYVKKFFIPAPARILITVFDALRYWKKGLKALQSKELNVDVLDAASILASVLQGSFRTAASIMMMLRTSELLEDYTRKRARQSLTESLALHVDCVWIIHNGKKIYTPISQVNVGDIIHVHAGSVIPLDGEISGGEALVNEASMTGEPHGVMRTKGHSVYAGMVVEEGSLELRVKALAGDTRIQNILTLIDNSESLKAEIQSKAEKLADTIVPFSFLAAAGTLILTGSTTRATSVLTVDYSCAIKLTTPICVISAMHEAAKHRILVKGGKYLEVYANADTIVFDKTGTLTVACPHVAKVIAFGGLSREYALRTAACLEEHFPHSVARAIVKQAEAENLKHNEDHAEPEYIVAHGISSKMQDKRVLIGSWHFITEDEGVIVTDDEKAIIEAESENFSKIFLAIDGRLAGMICLDDPVRVEAQAVLNELKQLGLERIIMLTGDSETAAKVACEKLGITEYYAGVSPEGKAEIVSGLKEQGSTVIMVGDGINDSLALSRADVSVAMKDGSDIAKEIADITLLSENLNGLLTLRHMSRDTFRRIHSNYRNIVAFNSALLLLGAFGVIPPSTSALLHNASTMLLCGVSMKRKVKGDFCDCTID